MRLTPWHLVPAQVWLSRSCPPPSYILQTLAARSREVIHCIRLRQEEAARATRLVGEATLPVETHKTPTASHINYR